MKPDYAARNRTAPDFELPALDGQKVRLSSYRGKTVILHFWTKTCVPCLEELPEIESLAKMLSPHRDVALITVTTDESAADADATLKSLLGTSKSFMTLVDPDGDTVVLAKYGTKLFPETWFIDPNGVVRARFDGPREWSGALTIDLARGLAGPVACEVTYAAGRATGPFAELCSNVAPGS
jgi:peroxiredoxin